MGSVFQRVRSVRRVRAAHQRAISLAPDPWNVDEFARAVSEYRQRPIKIVTRDLPAGLSGAWVPTPRTDYIVVESTTDAQRREVILCHELAHMLLGHQPPPAKTAEELPQHLARTGFSDVIEREAEVLATVILSRAQPGGEPDDGDHLFNSRLR